MIPDYGIIYRNEMTPKRKIRKYGFIVYTVFRHLYFTDISFADICIYTYCSCSKSYTTWECLEIFGFYVIYVTV